MNSVSNVCTSFLHCYRDFLFLFFSQFAILLTPSSLVFDLTLTFILASIQMNNLWIALKQLIILKTRSKQTEKCRNKQSKPERIKNRKTIECKLLKAKKKEKTQLKWELSFHINFTVQE